MKNGKGLGLLTQVDMRGKQDERREPQNLNSALDHEVKCSTAGQNFRHFGWLKLEITGKTNLLSSRSGPFPPISTHIINDPTPFFLPTCTLKDAFLGCVRRLFMLALLSGSR